MKLCANTSAYASVERIRSQDKRNTDLWNEFEKLKGEQIKLMPLLREYVSGLSAKMGQVRSFYRPKKEAWTATLEEWMNRYSQVASPDGSPIGGTIAFKVDEENNVIEENHLDVQFKERIATLQKTNLQLIM